MVNSSIEHWPDRQDSYLDAEANSNPFTAGTNRRNPLTESFTETEEIEIFAGRSVTLVRLIHSRLPG